MAGKSRGRQKIEMTRMSKESNLLVTFSKRRSGLFKKASELCTLCGAELAIIVFSPGKKVFCFGHPCVFTLINRYLNNCDSPTTRRGTSQLVVARHVNVNVNELNMQMMEMSEQLEVEKKKGVELSKIRKANDKKKFWWEKPISELGLQELEQLKEAMEELKKNVAKQADEKIIAAASGNFFGGSISPSVDAKVSSGLGVFSITLPPPPPPPHPPPHDYSFGFDRRFF